MQYHEEKINLLLTYKAEALFKLRLASDAALGNE